MISLSGSFWDHQVLRPAPTAHLLRVGGRAVLFDDGAQQIFELNETSATIWHAVCSEGTMARAAGALVDDEDVGPILEHIRGAVAEWLTLGLVQPVLSIVAEAEAPREVVRLAWMACRVELNLFGVLDAEPLLRVFAAFVSAEQPGWALDIREIGGVVFISDGQGRGCARSQEAWVPEVKARLTARILETVSLGFMVHAALLSRSGQGVLVCGDPGAGKTTLSMSLLSAGFAYHTDDVVWIGEGGEAMGAPFAPALKEGSWPLLDEMGVGVPTSETYLRGDGQQVRYLLPPASGGKASLRLGSILLLARDLGGPARIEAAEPLEVLTAVLGCAYSARGAISAESLLSLVGVIERARLGRLFFSDWRDGRRLIEGFAP